MTFASSKAHIQHHRHSISMWINTDTQKNISFLPFLEFNEQKLYVATLNEVQTCDAGCGLSTAMKIIKTIKT